MYELIPCRVVVACYNGERRGKGEGQAQHGSGEPVSDRAKNKGKQFARMCYVSRLGKGKV